MNKYLDKYVNSSRMLPSSHHSEMMKKEVSKESPQAFLVPLFPTASTINLCSKLSDSSFLFLSIGSFSIDLVTSKTYFHFCYTAILKHTFMPKTSVLHNYQERSAQFLQECTN